jgi:hemolysin activation/secretion protein
MTRSWGSSYKSILVASRRGWMLAVGAMLCTGFAQADQTTRFEIDEFRVEGNTVLPVRDVEAAVYDFLGPGRTPDDVEKARTALEDLYQTRGYPTVTVAIPRQAAGGVIRMVVTERRVGRLRVTNAQYFEPDAIRKATPSLAPGTVPNIKDVRRDMLALNRQPDRSVTPDLRPGREPNTMDVDLTVKDQLPLHGSLELNNRQTADTTPLRIVASLSYDNLWQRGDSIGLFFQVAPENTADALVYSVSYTFHIPGTDLSVLVSYLNSNSDVATIGGTNVVGKGQILGARLLVPLPGGDGFTQSIVAGMDYKDFAQDLTLSGFGNKVPITYYPVTISYNAEWVGEKSRSNLIATAVMGTSGIGSSLATFEQNRANAAPSFFYFRGSLAHTHELPWGLQFWTHAQVQWTKDPLVPNEQFAVGGADTVRGYLEAEALGDNAAVLQSELRGPSVAGTIGHGLNELRVHIFADLGQAIIGQPPTGTRSHFGLSSIGIGVRARFANHASASVEDAFVLSDATTTRHGANTVLFRLQGDF